MSAAAGIFAARRVPRSGRDGARCGGVAVPHLLTKIVGADRCVSHNLILSSKFIDATECSHNVSTFVNVCHDGCMTTAAVNGRTELPVLTDCCSPVVREVIDPAGADLLASRFKALADPARLRLISLIAAHADAEACVCDLTAPVGLSQPTVSHHLRILVEAGVLTREQRGKWAYYRVVPETLNALSTLLAPPVGS
jgi:ArsR family transcriptional regulator, arsenate/arsenite/antimonite-responsive transcriptional repressor